MKPRNDTALILRAVAFAADRHRGQLRKGADASPYINHPIAVASLLAEIGGVDDITVLVAAVLHDTVEDTHTTLAELETFFSPEVSSLVAEVTDDKKLPKDERKRLQVEHAPHMSAGAKLIKLGDKITNIGEVADRPATGWPPQRRREYLDWAERVVAGCRGVNPALEAKSDEELQRARQVLAAEDSGPNAI